MKKLSALLIVLLGVCLLPSCEMQDAEDIEPVTIEVKSDTIPDEDPSGEGGSGG